MNASVPVSSSLSSAQLNRSPWILLFIFILFLGVNSEVLRDLFTTWWVSYSEMGHGFLAPPLAAYVAWQNRGQLKNLSVQGSPWAAALLIFSVLIVVASSFARWIFPAQIAVWVAFSALIAFLLGWHWVRALAFPLALLLLAVPPPSFLYTKVTFELQLLASRLGEFGLELLGYSVLREGNVLRTAGGSLSVAEACSGIRSLVTLFFFFVVYGYFVVEKLWIRWILLLAVGPVAVLANGLRIVCTGVMVQFNPDLAKGLTHEMSGYITLFIGGAFLIAVGNQLERREPQTHAV